MHTDFFQLILNLSDYLSDPTDDDVRIATENLLADFLREIQEIALVQRRTQDKETSSNNPQVLDTPRVPGDEKEKLPEITMLNNDSAAFLPEDTPTLPPAGDNISTEKDGDAYYTEAGGML